MQDQYEEQKAAAGKSATFVWLISGLYLYLTTPGVTLLSWRAALFFLAGMFAAAVILGGLLYLVQRGIAKVLVRTTAGPSTGVAAVVGSLGIGLMIGQAIITYLAARTVFGLLEG